VPIASRKSISMSLSCIVLKSYFMQIPSAVNVPISPHSFRRVLLRDGAVPLHCIVRIWQTAGF
jgi:hypothetical protein